MKFFRILCICTFVFGLGVMLLLGPRDISINTSHFSGAWHNTDKTQYLLISNPNAFMEGVIYLADDELITEKKTYWINSTHHDGRKVFFRISEKSGSSAKIFQISEEDSNSMTMGGQSWYRITEPEHLEHLTKLVKDSI